MTVRQPLSMKGFQVKVVFKVIYNLIYVFSLLKWNFNLFILLWKFDYHKTKIPIIEITADDLKTELSHLPINRGIKID